MGSNQAKQLTVMLKAWGNGDESAEQAVIPLIYPELQRRAQMVLKSSAHRGATIQTQVLVHEAFLKLSDKSFTIKDRLHFYAVSSKILRNIMIDHVRELYAQKRGGGAIKLTLSNAADEKIADDAQQLLEINDLLDKLKHLYPRKARLCEMYYFSGLTANELAELENISVSTVNKDLRFARAWMKSIATIE